MKIYLKPGQSFKFDNGLEVEVEQGEGAVKLEKAVVELTSALYRIYGNMKDTKKWYIPSFSGEDIGYYITYHSETGSWTCECGDFKNRKCFVGGHCKHITKVKHDCSYKSSTELSQIAGEALGI